MVAFVQDYEHALGASFTPDEREVLDAANLAHIASGARCQHSDLRRHPELGETTSNGWIRLLYERRAG